MSVIAELARETARDLFRWLRKLGRWVLEHLAHAAGAAAVGYFRGRARDFERRRMALLPLIVAARKAKRTREIRRLVAAHQLHQWRRRVWDGFAAWLERHEDEITEVAVQQYAKASERALAKLPMVSAREEEARAA